jgi:E3 ubiquitin-protein ligase BRE1
VQARSYIEQIGKVMDDGRQHTLSLETLRRKTAETEKELLSTKTALEAANRRIEDRGHKLAEAQQQLDKERYFVWIKFSPISIFHAPVVS